RHHDANGRPRPRSASPACTSRPARRRHFGHAPAYLADVITRIVAGHPQSQLDDLLPWAYAPAPLKAVA
ncbi:transposase domain-containing protein, partial [Mesorhizobium sp. WSM3626]|uniref:transposase domain-containing protein n=1 Tax=Mesorhizobium sp. WSM3626 TaxID=1040987 RepID=UPI001FDAA692